MEDQHGFDEKAYEEHYDMTDREQKTSDYEGHGRAP